MKEYRVQFWAVVGCRWLPVHECNHRRVLTSEDEAKRVLREHEREHPGQRYRVIVRTVTEWEELV